MNSKPLPMLAHKYRERASKMIFRPGKYAAELKYDGHRAIVCVHSTSAGDGIVSAWSRTGIDCIQKFDKELVKQLCQLPSGLYDGELYNPKRQQSYGVSHLQSGLVFVIFDILEYEGTDVTALRQFTRRSILEKAAYGCTTLRLQVSSTWSVESHDEILNLAAEVWGRQGEGLIIKDTTQIYKPGKRSDAYLKLKECQHAHGTLLGFADSEGEIMKFGHYGSAVIYTPDDILLTVKVLDDDVRTRARCAEDVCESEWIWEERRMSSGKKVRYNTSHPWVGRELHFDYHQRTPDGNYREPRWDRFGDE